MLHQKIKKGDRVKVIVQREYENFNLVGKIGTVISAFSSGTGKIAIKLDDAYNPYSAKGYFYFPDINLAIEDTYSNNIKEKNQMNNITNYLNIANVTTAFTNTQTSNRILKPGISVSLCPKNMEWVWPQLLKS